LGAQSARTHSRAHGNLRPDSRRSIVSVDASLQEQIDRVAIARPSHGSVCARVNIECRDMKHFVEQMVLIAKELDIDYEAMRRQIELTRTR
jgi:hypothetical protein